MSKEYESIERGLQEAVSDAQGKIKLPRRTVEINDLVNRDNSNRLDIKRPCSITESIIESCKQVKLMQEGKSPKKTWKELRVELQKIKEENND